jgi:TatD DNase family protein
MKFIDTHSHLYSEKFNKDRSEVIASAIALGIETILLPNISSKYTDKMLDICGKFPKNCYPMMGLHPCDVTEKNLMKKLLMLRKS